MYVKWGNLTPLLDQSTNKRITSVLESGMQAKGSSQVLINVIGNVTSSLCKVESPLLISFQVNNCCLFVQSVSLILVLFLHLGVARISDDEDYGGLPSFELTLPIEHAIYTSASLNPFVPNFVRIGTLRATDKSGSITIEQGLSIESNISQAKKLLN